MAADRRLSIDDRLRYRGPVIDEQGVIVKHFTIKPESEQSFGEWLANWHHERDGRGTRPGNYSILTVDGKLWMSDTDAERRDHREPVGYADVFGGDALVNGLGMGCVVAAMLDSVDHVDVVESDQRIIDTVGRWYNRKSVV